MSTHRFRVRKSSAAGRAAWPAEVREGPVPACGRCRQLKKKCSRTPPQCELCDSAGAVCSLQADLVSSTPHLQERIRWLHEYVAQHLPSIESVPTGTNLSEVLRRQAPPAHVAFPEEDVNVPAENGLVHAADDELLSAPIEGPLDGEDGRPANGSVGDAVDDVEGSRVNSDLKPSMTELVEAYFQHVNKAYPFIDRSRLLKSAAKSADAVATDDAESTMLYLVMAIGCTTLERAGRLPRNSTASFNLPYTKIIQHCLVHQSGDSVQTLLLLTLYSLFDPDAPTSCSLLAIITRQAQFLGLTRRNSSLEKASPLHAELRHRLYWSIYTLDRMMAVSVGLPCLLDIRDSDIPLPSVTVQEFASCERSKFALSLQVNRHVIQLRQIEGNILSNIHHRTASETSLLVHLDRKAISSRLRLELENWYSAGCLICLPESDNLPIHSSLFWLNARYYHLLTLLYYPCRFNAQPELATASELLCFAQKYIQCNFVLLQQGQLPLNRVTLYRMLPVCLVFAYCFAKIGEPWSFPAWKEVSLCIDILTAFGDRWCHAHQAAAILRCFMDASSARVPLSGRTQDDESSGSLWAIKDGLTGLMKEAMGETCCYLLVEGWDDKLGSRNSIGPSQLAQLYGGNGPRNEADLWSFSGPFSVDFL